MSDQSPVARYLDPIRQYLRSYVKDDDDLLEHVLIACLSSYTSSPLNLGVMGPSSAGKTYVISLVTKLFPNAVSLTGASAKSFFYEEGTAIDPDTHEDLQGKIDDLQKRVDGGEEGAKSELRLLRRKAMIRVNLAGRILVFKESPGPELFESLKTILSHDDWESEYRTVDRGSSGEQKTRRILLVGWPVLIFASAKNEDRWDMWPEIQSRCVIVSPNTGEAKFQHANELTAQLLGLPSFALRQLFPEDLQVAARDDVKRIRHDIEYLRMLGEAEGNGSHRDNFVFNPFAARLSELFPHDSGLRQRQFRYLLDYVNILAMIGAASRPSVVIKGQARAVVADLSDVDRAARLVFSSTWASLPRYKLDFFDDVVVPAWEANKKGAVSTKKIMEFAREHGTRVGPNRLRKTFLEPLEEASIVSSATDPDDKRGLVWEPIQTAQKYGRLGERRNFDPQQVKQSLKSLSNQIGDLVVNFSYPDGRLVSDLEELALSLMEGGEGLDPSSQTNEPTMPNSETVPGPEQHDSRPGSEQGEKRGVEGTPTPPKSRIVSKCVDCGKEPTAGENFTLKGVGELCREHFEKRTAARREVKERKEGGED